MNTIAINNQLLPDNTCLGCGTENPHGLHIEIFADEENDNRVVGIFDPSVHLTGFPGITHGGAIYTALDCIAAWAPTALRRETKAVWILRSANITYHKAAHQQERLSLSAVIEQEGEQWQPMLVHAEARNPQGELLADGKFKVIPLPAKKFQKVAGIAQMPANWQALLE